MPEIVHLAEIRPRQLLYLKKIQDHHFAWFTEGGKETEVTAPNIEEAIRLAKSYWKNDYFSLVPCGFRFTLPERDEHGSNALFYQAVKSLNSMNGIYFDDELSCNCIVHQIPLRIREIYQEIKEV